MNTVTWMLEAKQDTYAVLFELADKHVRQQGTGLI